MADRFFSPLFLWVDGEGRPLAGGSVEFYDAGTSTPKTIYSDASGTTPRANPVTLNGDGYSGPIFGDGAYKVVLKDAEGVTVWTAETVQFSPTVPITIANGGTGATDAAQARTNLGLGTAALLNSGVSPGNVVIVQASGQIDQALIPATVSAARGPGENIFLTLHTR